MIEPPAMNEVFPTLSFHGVTIESSQQHETGLWNSSFECRRGELFLVRVERENERLSLADAAQGLALPREGKVSFLGEDWQAMPADRAAQQRGRIGRLFEEEGWISDLDVQENILLAQRYHTSRTEDDIIEEALKLARVFGLPGLPLGPLAGIRRWDLRRAACIRAFLGRPVFLIIEHPARGVYADLMAPLIAAVQSARESGAAVLWTVADPRIWNDPDLQPTRRARMFGSELQSAELEA